MKEIISPTPLMTTKDAARYMKLSPGTLTVWRCTKRYDLKYVKVGRAVRYAKSDLDAFLFPTPYYPIRRGSHECSASQRSPYCGNPAAWGIIEKSK